MKRVQVPLPRVLIMQTDKASREQVAYTMARYGYSIVGPFGSWADSVHLISPGALEAAVVDWSSCDEAGHRAARRLVELDIPLVFYAAPDEFTAWPADLRHVPFLVKPDQAGLVLKHISTELNQRLVRRWQPLHELLGITEPRKSAR